VAKSPKSGKPSAKASRSSAPPTNVVAQARKGRAPKSASADWRGWLWENFKALLGAVLIFLFIRTFFVEAYKIPSGSMIPTLLVGDWLFVNKVVYGPAVPFTTIHLPGYSAPHRGDVVVFISPPQRDHPENPTPTLVKRLIGLPGDTIYMRNGVVYIDGVAYHPKVQIQGYTGPPQNDPTETTYLFSWQNAIALHDTRFGSAPAVPTHDNWGPLLIPAAHYFMMGDNRYCSEDSRYWGVVPRANIRGRPLFVYYSYRPDPGPSLTACDGQVSDRPLSFLTDIRWGRIGHIIR
jgi:signal peptidase I